MATSTTSEYLTILNEAMIRPGTILESLEGLEAKNPSIEELPAFIGSIRARAKAIERRALGLPDPRPTLTLVQGGDSAA